MRREGYIIEEIIDYSNMAESFKQVLRGKKSGNAADKGGTFLRIRRR